MFGKVRKINLSVNSIVLEWIFMKDFAAVFNQE